MKYEVHSEGKPSIEYIRRKLRLWKRMKPEMEEDISMSNL